MFDFLRVTGLFFVTAVAEIVGCYLPWLVLTQGRPVWWLLPAAAIIGRAPDEIIPAAAASRLVRECQQCARTREPATTSLR